MRICCKANSHLAYQGLRRGCRKKGCGCSSGVEHNLAKVGVEGSNPFARSNCFSPEPEKKAPHGWERNAESLAENNNAEWAGRFCRTNARRLAARRAPVSPAVTCREPHPARHLQSAPCAQPPPSGAPDRHAPRGVVKGHFPLLKSASGPSGRRVEHLRASAGQPSARSAAC